MIVLDKILIVIGSFILHFVTFGMTQSFGVLFTELLDYFGSGKSEAGWIPSLHDGLMLGGGVVAGLCATRFGNQLTGVIGSLVMSIGIVSSMFVKSIHVLYATYGVVGGCGAALLHVVANVVIGENFDTRMSLAMGVASLGTAIGNFVLPPLISYLINEYGWRGSFLLLGAVSLQGMVGGMLLVKTKSFKKRDVIDKDRDIDPNAGGKDIRNESSSINCQQMKSFLTTPYICFTVSGFFTYVALFVPFVMLPDRMKKKDIPEQIRVFAVSSMGIGNIIGRVVTGVIGDCPCIKRISLHIAALCVAGLLTLTCSYMKQYEFIIYGLIFGGCMGTFAVLQCTIVVDMVGTERLGMAIGCLTMVEGVGGILGNPMAGWISDITGSDDGAFYFAGSLFLLGSVMAFTIPLKDIFCCSSSVSSYKIKNKDIIEQAQLQTNKDNSPAQLTQIFKMA